MNIIHPMKTLPRLVSATLSERMRVMPAVVVTGARQSGKITLAEQLVSGARAPSQHLLDHAYFYKIIEARDFLRDMP
jgi:hypothetical protein